MTTTVSVFGIVVLIFVLHTILTHLINWMFREGIEEHTGSLLFLSVVVGLIEGIICLVVLDAYI